jgi:hypothetical protein
MIIPEEEEAVVTTPTKCLNEVYISEGDYGICKDWSNFRQLIIFLLIILPTDFFFGVSYFLCVVGNYHE